MSLSKQLSPAANQRALTSFTARGRAHGWSLWLAAGLLLGAASAQADERNQWSPDTGSWYLKALGGLGWLGDTDYLLSDAAGQSPDGAGALQLDAGFGAGLSAGYDFGRWRLEGEYLYQTNDIAELSLAGLPAGTTDGDFAAVVIAANLLAEWNLPSGRPTQGPLQVWGGVGLAWVQEVDIDFMTPTGERSFSTSDFGVQLLAGVEYRLTDNWSAGIEGRYLAAGGLDLDREERAGGEGGDFAAVTADYDRTSVLLSLRYRF